MIWTYQLFRGLLSPKWLVRSFFSIVKVFGNLNLWTKTTPRISRSMSVQEKSGLNYCSEIRVTLVLDLGFKNSVFNWKSIIILILFRILFSNCNFISLLMTIVSLNPFHFEDAHFWTLCISKSLSNKFAGTKSRRTAHGSFNFDICHN